MRPSGGTRRCDAALFGSGFAYSGLPSLTYLLLRPQQQSIPTLSGLSTDLGTLLGLPSSSS